MSRIRLLRAIPSALVFLVLFPTLSAPSVAATKVSAIAKTGAKCPKAGATSKVGSTVFTCTKAGKVLVWQAQKSATMSKGVATLAVKILDIPKGSNVSVVIQQLAPIVAKQKLFSKTLSTTSVLKNLAPGTYRVSLNKSEIATVEGKYIGLLSQSKIILKAKSSVTVSANFKTFIPKTTIVIAKPLVSAVTVVNPTSIQLTVPSTELPKPTIGEYVLLGVSDQIPGGFIGQITSTNKDGSVVLTTASIFAAIPQASVEASSVIPQDAFTVTPTDSTGTAIRAGQTFLRSGSKTTPVNSQKSPFQMGCTATSNAHFLAGVTLSLEPHLALNWNVGASGVVINSASSTVVASLGLGDDIGASGSLDCNATLTSRPVPITVLGIPFFITVSGGLFLNGQVDASTVTNLSYSISTGFGFDSASGFHGIYQTQLSSELSAEVSADLKFGLTGSILARPGLPQPLGVTLGSAFTVNADLNIGLQEAKAGMHFGLVKNLQGTDLTKELFFEAAAGIDAELHGTVKVLKVSKNFNSSFIRQAHLGPYKYPLGVSHLGPSSTPQAPQTPQTPQTPSGSRGQDSIQSNIACASDSQSITQARYWGKLANSLDGVHMIASSYIGIFTSSDGGCSWKFRLNDSGAVGISADGSHLIVGSTTGQDIRTSSDFGETWVDSGIHATVGAVTSSTSGNVLAAAADESGGRIYISHNAGATWTPSGPSLLWESVSTSGDGKKLIGSGQGQAGQETYLSIDSGITWQRILATEVKGIQVFMSSDGNQEFASEAGCCLWRSTDSGVTWTSQLPGEYRGPIAFSSEGRRIAALIGDINSNFTLYQSSDFGKSWTTQNFSAALAGPWALSMSNDGSLLIITYQKPGDMYRSYDAGKTWSAVGSTK